MLIEGAGRIGRGVAYSSRQPAHLLNVRAESMSAWAGEPDHFTRYAEPSGVEPRDFAERQLYGRYLSDILDEAVAGGLVSPVAAVATGAARSGTGWRVALDDGSAVEAAALILATGNQQPDGLPAFAAAGDRFIRNPWGDEARAAIADATASNEPVLLVGTGLTAVDLLLSLDVAGHRGRILALSRHGQIPRAHADFPAAPVGPDEPPKGLNRLFRWLRQRSAEVGWRAAIDCLRPHSHAIWQGLPVDEQQRFLRHARAWWDVHRHRIAPAAATAVDRLVAEGQLEIAAGRILSAQPAADGLDVEYRSRGSRESITEHFAYAFNCTGPLHAIDHTADPLLRALLDSSQVAPDALGIALATSADNRVGERLWALGPLTKGRYWEITAVPDISKQAAAVADDVERELKV